MRRHATGCAAYHAHPRAYRPRARSAEGDAARRWPGGPARTIERTDSRESSRRGDGAQTRSEEHTSELQSLMRISYAVFCLKKKNIRINSEAHHRHHKQLK